MVNTNVAGDAGMQTLADFMAENLRQFMPFAYHDKHLDCIRVQIMDCSITEERLNRIFTIYHANHSDINGGPVGFSVKGVAHLFKEMGLEIGHAINIADLLDAIVKVYPEETVKYAKEMLSPSFGEIQVSFDEEDRLAA